MTLRGIELRRSAATGMCEVFADFGPDKLVRIISDNGDAICHYVNWQHVLEDLVSGKPDDRLREAEALAQALRDALSFIGWLPADPEAIRKPMEAVLRAWEGRKG